ncbi:hypothetical protein BDF14DRAFT_1858418 [Spinellus fusiger]|nr:hypothetical protein BDF14DRAFT_1858418 [Spinellus fusiger]
MLQHNWPKERLRLELFGSSANGLGFDDSDLDLSIVVPEEHYKNDLINMYQLANQSTFYNMRYLGDSLRRIGMKNVKPIKRATVPICKFQDAQSGIHCDINSSNILGIENSKLIKAYTLLDKRVRPFLLAVKQLVKTRNINEASKGTLSSYTYVLMALWYLVQCDPPVIPNLQCISQKCRSTLCSSKLSTSKLTVFQQKIIECDVTYHSCVRVVHKNRPDYEMKPVVNASLIPRKETLWMCHNVQDVGDILKGFLHYFGYEYDYGQYALSLYRGQLVPKGTWSSAHFAVQDPFILGRNVAATTTLIGFNAIKNEFKRAYDLLSSHSSFQDICVSPDYSLFDPDTIEQRILRRNRVKNVDKKAHENDIIEQQKEPKNKTKPQLHAKEFIPLNRLTAANTEYKTVDDLPVSAQEFNESEENIKPFAISISSSAITSVDQKTNPPKTTKVLESTVETVSVTLEPIQPSLPDVLPTPEPIQPSEPIQPPEPMQQRPSSSSPVLKKNKANSQSQLTYAQKVMQALFKSENQKTAPSLSSKIPNGNVSNSTSSSVFRTTKTPVKAPSVPVNTSPTPVPETSNKLKNVKEKEKESIQVKTPTDSPVPVKILPLLAPPSSPLPSTSLTTKNSSEKKKKKKKKKSVKQETEPVISKQEELLDLSGVMDYPSTPRISTFKITTEEETQEETREEETQEETREETQEEETEASSLQENSHNSPHSKTQSTMETDIKTLKLLYVPEYIDRLDIIDVLDQYGEVLKLKELDTFQFTAFETYSHWSASILLDKHHQVFPEEIELWDRCITVNSN